ncbi:efflux RND transporter periplasmic adaptor subunit [Accumulibacter sp.]|uniref:efflux RND transporter periplasmic adaptor subunit n=1 Tax=Accumulibacter sp. TaxID=2053492 RepID=UPI00261C28DE|nr:efflux RND transporter periplasmic adaptor subunit [Accumulibacter sp.]
MKQGSARVIGFVALLAVAAGAGYWLGGRGAASSPDANPAAGEAGEPRKILYYRNPMGLPDTSPVPKKDAMGMDYTPVYADEQETDPAAAGQIRISTEKVQKLGVRSEAAQQRRLDRTLRAAGRIVPNEGRQFTITAKFEGYVERLHVNVNGQPVAKGQPLFEVYSPELVSAQREYAIAAQGVAALEEAGGEAQAGMRELAAASLQRLRNWDISAEQVRELAASGASRRTMTFRSPVAGIVTEKKAQQGMRFTPGETLYQVADLSSVWVIAEVFEQDIGLLRTGSHAKIRVNAYPEKVFHGVVSYIYPTLEAATRTVALRIELANPDLLLKPAMFAQVELPVAGRSMGVSVPLSAVIDSGKRQIVLIELGEGRFAPREVKLGARSDDYVEVLDGVRDGERVVVAANFLIDAESNLKAAIGGLAPASTAAAAVAPPGKAAGPGHRAEGTVIRVDAGTGTVELAHGPVDSLKWPAMSMPFKVANDSLLTALAPGGRVAFEFVERQPGEWVITAVEPLAGGATQPRPANPHAGH